MERFKNTQCQRCLNANKAVTAVVRCTDCDQLLCQDCKRVHSSQESTQSHTLVIIRIAKILYCDQCLETGTHLRGIKVCSNCIIAICGKCLEKHDQTHTLCEVSGTEERQEATAITCHMNAREQKLVTNSSLARKRLPHDHTQEQEQSQHLVHEQMESSYRSVVNHPTNAKITKPCDPCQEDHIEAIAVLHCQQCEENFCEGCSKAHKTQKVSKSHQLVDMATLALAFERSVVNNPTNAKISKPCDPCQEDNREAVAVLHCQQCDENFCEGCSKAHKTQKATRTHQLVDVATSVQEGTVLNHPTNAKITKPCDPCQEDHREVIAVLHCQQCDENFCEGCSKAHKTQKATKTHQLVDVVTLALASDRSVGNYPTHATITKPCDPCQEDHRDAIAVLHCQQCDENFCEGCSKAHKTQKATKNHQLVDVATLVQEGTVLNHPTNAKITKPCNPCQEDHRDAIAVLHCQQCDENFCEGCSKAHKTQKATKTHKLVDLATLALASDRSVGNYPTHATITKPCDPCQEDHRDAIAVLHCQQCDENFCEGCSKAHKTQKATKTHQLVDVATLALASDRSVVNYPSHAKIMKPCDPCQEDHREAIAVLHCQQCDENFCEGCTNAHKTQKATKTHQLVDVATLAFASDSRSVVNYPTHVKITKPCDPCQDDHIEAIAVLHCQQCDENFCEECSKAHTTQKATKFHQLVDMATLLLASESYRSPELQEVNERMLLQIEHARKKKEIEEEKQHRLEEERRRQEEEQALSEEQEKKKKRVEEVQRIEGERLKMMEQEEKQRKSEILQQKQEQTDLMKCLGLTSYAPSQLSIQDAMRMMSSKEGESLSETDLPGLLLYHLMKNNYRWRDKVQQHITNAGEGRKEEHSNLASGHQANKLFDNDFESFLNEVELCSESFSTPVIHPSDILLNTIMCCNLELKQILFQKLLMCKQSVPLIYRIPSHDKPCYSIFPLRSMSMECRTKIGATLLCAATMKSKVVGFIRVGNSRYSKSKLLNNILSEQKHATFCHRDDVDVNTKPLNAKGLIEAAWFLPSRKPSDPFEEVITFLNLRGDAAGLPNEIAITGIITSAVVTLIDISCLEHEDTIVAISDLCKCSAHIIVLLTNSYGGISAEKFKSILRHCFPNPREKVKFVQTFSWNTNNLKPEVTLRKELLSAIKLAIQEKEGSSLSEYGKALFQNKQVILDETTNDHVEAKSAAKFIFAGLCSLDEAKLFLQTDNDDIPKVTSKEEHLPLQGDLWKKWSELKKTQHKNKGGNDIYELQGSIQNNMDDIRKKQGQKCSQLKQSMSRFIENLIKANARKNGYPNFLLWLKLILNENSRNVLPGLLTELCQLWLKVTEAKETNASDKEIKLFQDAAEEAEIKLAKASFGLEHFMRELGQVYESADESPLPPKQPISDNIPKQKLPSVMADLLLEGQAFEIMDGDAANIAISWVTEVLKHLKAKIGNKTLFIVSVLGIQSSGKSTLLNALFGLQFTVSAGRCTRGVFGQLAPVDKKNNLPYDYILVVDTEGLRAPELGQMHLDHDNELATFVIGIGDVTLINIKGENTAEMKDVLQIAVQAFLRMKLANDKMELKRKCIFIHQNVGAVNAEEQMMQGLKKFQETLDMMTKNAAEEENMRHIQSFSQVIDFQGEKHVLYFPDLWYGDPPMAPCNPGYSIKVMEVLRRLEQIAKSGCALTTIDGLIHRIEDLWNGIMAENFVFSFRNTLEIKTYNSMESKYQELSSEYYSYLMEWFENTATIEIDLCKSEEDLQKRCEDLKHTLPMNFVQRKEKIEKKLLDYFDNHDLAYILIQWKNLRLLKFQAMAESVERHTLDYIEQKKEERRIDILSTGTDRKLEKEINAKAKDLAETYRGQEVEKWKLESTFDKVWIDWTKEFIQTKHCDTSTGQIESMLIKILHQLLPQNITLVLQEISDTEMKQRLKKLEIPHLENSWTQRDINVEHIDKKPPSGFFKEALTKAKDFLVGKNKPSLDKEDILDAIEYTNNVFRKMDVEFVDLLQKDVQIRPEHATDIIKKTIDCFDSENNKPDHKLTFQTPYKVKLVVYICSFAFSKFKFMAGRYEKKHGVKGKLAAYKETAKHLFLNTVQKKSYEFVAADFFCDRVKERVIATIENAIPRQIVEDIMRHFSYDKYHVMLSVMEDLGRKNHFPSFISYVKDSKSFVHSWMDTFIKKTIFETTGASDSRYIELAKSRLAKIMKCIKEAIVIATEHTISKGGNWAKSFESRVKTELAVPSEFLDPVTRKIKDLKDFKEKLLEKQADLENAVIEEFHSCDPNGKVWKGTSPIETVMKEIWGCPEQCPFCSEPCQRNEGHLSDKVSHSCIQHRPLCVRGTTWKTINTLDIEPCNFKVQSDNLFDCGACKLKCRESGKCTMSGDERVYHPFKEYNTYLPDWDIAPNPTMDVSKYWMWFVVKFIKELCAQYRAAETDIPESWKAIRDKDAIDSLRLAVN